MVRVTDPLDFPRSLVCFVRVEQVLSDALVTACDGPVSSRNLFTPQHNRPRQIRVWVIVGTFKGREEASLLHRPQVSRRKGCGMEKDRQGHRKRKSAVRWAVEAMTREARRT